MSFKENVYGVQGAVQAPGRDWGAEPLMGVRGQCHLEVKFAVFWHKKATTDFFVLFFVVKCFLFFFDIFLGGQNVLLVEIRDIAEKDIAWSLAKSFLVDHFINQSIK